MTRFCISANIKPSGQEIISNRQSVVSGRALGTTPVPECIAEAREDAITATDVVLAQLVSKTDLRDALAHLKINLLEFMFGAMAAQTALIVALIQLLR